VSKSIQLKKDKPITKLISENQQEINHVLFEKAMLMQQRGYSETLMSIFNYRLRTK